MRPSDNYRKVLRIIRFTARACGTDVVDPNFKPNFITYFTGFCITVYFIFSVYTVAIKIHEGWGILLESFCVVGSVFQGISTFSSLLIFKNLFSSQCNFLLALYVDYEVKGKDYAVALNKCSSRVRVIFQIAAYMYLIVAGCILSTPLVMFTFTGRRVMPLQYYMPFLDTDTLFGYSATVGMQSVCVVLGVLGNFAGDMFMLLFFAHVTLFVDIMMVKIKELNALAEDFGNPLIMEMLMDILQWHQTYTTYATVTGTCFFWINTVKITTSGLSIVLTLFVIFAGDWISSYAYVVYLFAVMYFYCGMGTLTEIANDNFMEEIYDIHWYNLTLTQQSIVGFMLMKSQSPQKITVGGVIPLSVSTGLQVTKTVYSVFMMLVNAG